MEISEFLFVNLKKIKLLILYYIEIIKNVHLGAYISVTDNFIKIPDQRVFCR